MSVAHRGFLICSASNVLIRTCAASCYVAPKPRHGISRAHDKRKPRLGIAPQSPSSVNYCVKHLPRIRWMRRLGLWLF